ncbi:hypothetical protein C173_05236 [Paenibacillus sp. FSL R7-277]|uniref:DUF3600 domain-containing protein n=1 Tax=unclassified Paenibacillus TaxID=185978 RepID=UPI0003E1DAF5|nr:DUF3600 domain-containing protein [Paenibacillus sp. FSL R7-277]ETT77217.1 hypothetical protein C173_05236 [Paenibacillus sp. FSL R7-277]
MNFNEKLRIVLQEEARNIKAPPELKEKILNQIITVQGGRRMKRKWLVAVVLAATLIIPTGAFAGYHYLADGVYGSREAAATIGVTQQKYEEFETKLQSMKHVFSEKEMTSAMLLLKELGSYNLLATDAAGVFHLEQLDPEEQKAYKKLQTELEPYFNKLNEMEVPKARASDVDRVAFWDNLLEKAEQKLTKQEFREIKPIIVELQGYDAKATDSDGSVHMDRLSTEEIQNQEKLLKALTPYVNKLDLMIKSGS